MFKVFTTDKSNYEAISFPTDYLYIQYDKIISFLNQNYAGKYNNILAKPIIDGGYVNWYANSNKKYDRISKLPNEIQNQIKSKYIENLKDFNLSIERFKQSNKIEERNWGELLSKVFNDDNNIILSDGDDFILLWGWKFRNKVENYLAPNFIPTSEGRIQEEQKEEPVIFGSMDFPNESPRDNTTIINGRIPEPKIPGKPKQKGNSNFGHRLKRYFRNFTFRYWALMLLIILIFLLLCLCKSCNNSNAQLNELNKKLEKAENKVKNNCP